MHEHHAEACIPHGRGRVVRPLSGPNPTTTRPSATARHDSVGERRGRCPRLELLAFEGPRIPPCGCGAFGRNRSASSRSSGCVGGVGTGEPDRPPTGTSSDRSNLRSRKSGERGVGRYDIHRVAPPKPRTLSAGGEQAPANSSGVPQKALSDQPRAPRSALPRRAAGVQTRRAQSLRQPLDGSSRSRARKDERRSSHHVDRTWLGGPTNDASSTVAKRAQNAVRSR